MHRFSKTAFMQMVTLASSMLIWRPLSQQISRIRPSTITCFARFTLGIGLVLSPYYLWNVFGSSTSSKSLFTVIPPWQPTQRCAHERLHIWFYFNGPVTFTDNGHRVSLSIMSFLFVARHQHKLSHWSSDATNFNFLGSLLFPSLLLSS